MKHRPPASSVWALALALLSAGVTAAQVALMQLLSCVQWHHFAYLVVSVALLGYGASGTVLSLWREALLARATAFAPWLLIGAGAGFAGVPAVLQLETLRFDLYLLFVDTDQWARLAGACLLLALPFFCAGLATALIMFSAVEHIGRLYAANLIGAGAGALGALALLEWLAPPRLPALTAILPLVGVLVLPRQQGPDSHSSQGDWAPSGPRTHRKSSLQESARWRLVALVGLAVVAALAWHATLPGMSPFKDLSRTLNLPGARIVVSQPSAQGWLQIVAAPALRGAPPTSLGFTGTVPRQHAVFLDGNRYGSLLVEQSASESQLAIFTASPEVLPWRLGAPQRVLLVHEGGGGEAVFAREQGASNVALVEPHRAYAVELRRRLAVDPSINITAMEPRLALAQAAAQEAARYDMIRFPNVGTFGGSAGLRAVGEEFLLTREGIAAAWHALTPGGMLLVTAWMDHPERTVLRLLRTMVAGLEHASGVDSRAHLLAVRGWNSVTILLCRRTIGKAEMAAVRDFCDEHGFDPLLLPGLRPEERSRHHAWENADFFTHVDAIFSRRDGTSEQVDSLFRLDAPSDDRPYFSQFLRVSALGTLVRTQGLQGAPFFELGYIIVVVTAIVLFVLAAVLIVLPLGRAGWTRGGRGWTFAYFAALGAGFMLLEIVLMLRLTPFAGGAVPAAAIVINTLLIGAGLGSRWSQRWQATRAVLIRITAGAAAGALFLGVALNLLPIGWDLAWPARCVVCTLLIAPVAFVLGMAFPTGLRHLASRAPTHVPWAWAINNCLSVVTPSLATIAALHWGHTAVFGCAGTIYAIAALSTCFSERARG